MCVLKVLFVVLVTVTCVSASPSPPWSGLLRVRVSPEVPRHQCRRALRNVVSLVTEASRQLHLVSEGREQVTACVLELPPGWRGTECSSGLLVAEGGLGRSWDVSVSSPHPVLGTLPHSIQPGGCGVRGLGVALPFPVLTLAPSIQTRHLQEALLAITRWRYGVFPEKGEQSDPMYPANTTEGLLTRPNTGCSASDLDLGAGLCPLSSTYDSGAMTKQNLLCSGMSARQTILSLVSAAPARQWTEPSLTYVMPLDTERVVLILDMGPAMAPLWETVLSATFQYIHSLREGTELAIVSYQSEGTVHLQPTRVEGGNREGLHYRIPRRLDTTNTTQCPQCGVELARSLATNTTTIVLLSSSLHPSHKNSSELMELGGSANPIIRRVVLAPPTLGQHQLTDQVFLIDDRQSRLNISSQLSLALASLTEDAASQKFHLEQLAMVGQEGSFSVEPSLSSDLWLQLLTEDTTDIQVFEVRSPSGQVFSFPKFDAGLVYFSLRGPQETGVWSYRIGFYSAPRPSSSLLLECWASGSLGLVRLSSWTSGSPTLPNSPVLLYARLEAGGVPVVGALVEAEVLRPGDLDPVTVTLEDSGSGYPDITRGDGIYSGYFTQFAGEPGVYSVTVRASNNNTASMVNTKKLASSPVSCCGSSLPTEPAVPLEAFTRFTSAPSFPVTWGAEFYLHSGSVQRRDVFPPSRISDFRLANSSTNSLFVTLAWTAPGDDLTLGRAFRYEIRCFTAKEALSQGNFGEQGILVHSSLVPVPEPRGKEQRSTVSVPWPNEVFYYAIVAFDAVGNRGEVSNMLSVYVKEQVTTLAPELASNQYLSMKDSMPLKSPLNESMMYVIAGIISLILITVVIILALIIRRLGGCGTKTSPLDSLAPSSPPPSPQPSLPPYKQSPLTEPFSRSSISYISGYDLPEMLEYSMLGHAVPQGPGQGVSLPPRASLLTALHHGHHTESYYTRAERPLSPSPVNSIYTAGQSTDCSVSVSGSDHELVVGDTTGLQVVTVREVAREVARDQGREVARDRSREVGREVARDQSRENRKIPPAVESRKIPPVVPSKTVHASLV